MEKLALDGGEPIRKRDFPKWPQVTDRSRIAINDVLESGHWWQTGEGRTAEFESWIADYIGGIGAVAITNGTHALELSFKALEMQKNSQVLLSAITFISTATAVSLSELIPVPVDVNFDTLSIDTNDLEKKISKESSAICPVHLAGQACDMDSISKIADVNELYVVEDNAQGIGAEWNGKKAGGFGDLSTYSFQAAKLLTSGEGGAIVVRDDEKLLEKLKIMANCGRPRGSKKYDHSIIASNYRMTEFQAALLMSQTSRLDELSMIRNNNAQRLQQELKVQTTCTPISVDINANVMPWYMFLIRMPQELIGVVDNAQFAAALTEEGIPATRIYPPFYMTKAFSEFTEQYNGSCPNAEQASNEVIWLHHRLLLDDETGIEDIIKAVKKVTKLLPESVSKNA